MGSEEDGTQLQDRGHGCVTLENIGCPQALLLEAVSWCSPLPASVKWAAVLHRAPLTMLLLPCSQLTFKPISQMYLESFNLWLTGIFFPVVTNTDLCFSSTSFPSNKGHKINTILRGMRMLEKQNHCSSLLHSCPSSKQITSLHSPYPQEIFLL